jgi:hypothetical protein
MHARAPRARVKISTRIFGLPMARVSFSKTIENIEKFTSVCFSKLHSRDRLITYYYYMASIISGEMADCDWLRSTFRGLLFSRNVIDQLSIT